jgi:hypothetical protein
VVCLGAACARVTEHVEDWSFSAVNVVGDTRQGDKPMLTREHLRRNKGSLLNARNLGQDEG